MGEWDTPLDEWHFLGPSLTYSCISKPTLFNKRKTWIHEKHMHVTPRYKKIISTHISKISPTKLQSKLLWSQACVKAAEDEKLWAQSPSVSGVVTLLCKDPPNGLREHFPSVPPAALSWPPGYVWSESKPSHTRNFLGFGPQATLLGSLSLHGRPRASACSPWKQLYMGLFLQLETSKSHLYFLPLPR